MQDTSWRGPMPSSAWLFPMLWPSGTAACPAVLVRVLSFISRDFFADLTSLSTSAIIILTRARCWWPWVLNSNYVGATSQVLCSIGLHMQTFFYNHEFELYSIIDTVVTDLFGITCTRAYSILIPRRLYSLEISVLLGHQKWLAFICHLYQISVFK